MSHKFSVLSGSSAFHKVPIPIFRAASATPQHRDCGVCLHRVPVHATIANIRRPSRVYPACCKPPQPNITPESNGVTTPRTTGNREIPSSVPAPTFYAAAVTELFAALLGWALCNASRLPALGPNFTVTTATFTHAITAATIFSALFWVIEKAPTGINDATDGEFRAIFDSRSLPEVAFFCICVSLGEELLFRAWLLAALCALGVPQISSLVISSLVFGAFHAYTALYIVLATLAGGLLGAMFLTTGSTFEPLVVHFLYDFATISMMKARWQSKTYGSLKERDESKEGES